MVLESFLAFAKQNHTESTEKRILIHMRNPNQFIQNIDCFWVHKVLAVRTWRTWVMAATKIWLHTDTILHLRDIFGTVFVIGWQSPLSCTLAPLSPIRGRQSHCLVTFARCTYLRVTGTSYLQPFGDRSGPGGVIFCCLLYFFLQIFQGYLRSGRDLLS